MSSNNFVSLVVESLLEESRDVEDSVVDNCLTHLKYLEQYFIESLANFQAI